MYLIYFLIRLIIGTIHHLRPVSRQLAAHPLDCEVFGVLSLSIVGYWYFKRLLGHTSGNILLFKIILRPGKEFINLNLVNILQLINGYIIIIQQDSPVAFHNVTLCLFITLDVYNSVILTETFLDKSLNDALKTFIPVF